MQTLIGNPILDESKKYYAMISGGKDSMTACHYIASKGCLAGCVFFDTGICANETRAFVESIKEYSVEIIPTPERYEWFVWKFGFPHYKGHEWVKNHIKGRALRQFKAKHEGEELTLASGTRRYESKRRRMLAKPLSEWEGVSVISPLYH